MQTVCTIIFRAYYFPVKRKYANGLKHQTQARMGATRPAGIEKGENTSSSK